MADENSWSQVACTSAMGAIAIATAFISSKIPFRVDYVEGSRTLVSVTVPTTEFKAAYEIADWVGSAG